MTNRPWLRDLTRRDWLFNGGLCTEEQWAGLDWDKASVDMGPSPMGNPGPYWHVPHADGTVARLYLKLPDKWRIPIWEAVQEHDAHLLENLAQALEKIELLQSRILNDANVKQVDQHTLTICVELIRLRVSDPDRFYELMVPLFSKASRP